MCAFIDKFQYGVHRVNFNLSMKYVTQGNFEQFNVELEWIRFLFTRRNYRYSQKTLKLKFYRRWFCNISAPYLLSFI